MRTTLALLFLLLEMILGGCNSRSVWVVVNVEGLLPEVRSLGATIRLNGQLSKEGDLRITSNLQKFGVQLSLKESDKNHFHITVAGLDASDNVILGDEQEADIASASSVEVTVKLHSTQVCNPLGWCWSNPLPQGNRLNAFSAPDAKTVWAVGDGGMVLRWNGWYSKKIEVSIRGSSQPTMLGVWAKDFDQAWVVGELGSIAQCTGSSCVQVFEAGTFFTNTTNLLQAVYGFDSNNVWVAGVNIVLRCSDTGCLTISGAPSALFSSIWGSDPEQMWVSGDGGNLLKCGGVSCVSIPSKTQSPIHKIWGIDANNIWALSDNGIVKCVNNECSYISVGSAGVGLNSIWASDINHAWVVGAGGSVYKCTDNACTFIQTGASSVLFSIWGSDTENVWAVGPNSTVVRCSGGTCSTISPMTAEPLMYTWGTDINQFHAISLYGKILTCNDGTCAVRPSQAQYASRYASMNAIWGGDGSNVWVAGDSGLIFKCDHQACSSVASKTANNITAAWGSDINNIWFVGHNGTVIKCNDTICTPIPSGTTKALFALWGVNANTIWAVGEGETIIKCNNAACSVISTGVSNRSLTSIWGPLGVDNVWIVGYNGAMFNCVNNMCVSKSSGTSAHLTSTWGPASGAEFWAVGWMGTVLKCNTGATPVCTSIKSGITEGLNSVWGNYWRIFAATSNGKVLICERDGSGCTLSPSYGIGAPLITVSGDADVASSIWVVGYDGAFLEDCGPPGPSGCQPRNIGTSSVLNSVWGTRDGVSTWIAGSQGAILHRYQQ